MYSIAQLRSPGGAEESLTGAVPALADVAPVADVARIAGTAHAVANGGRRRVSRNASGQLFASRL
jgi:hypothetical protein